MGPSCRLAKHESGALVIEGGGANRHQQWPRPLRKNPGDGKFDGAAWYTSCRQSCEWKEVAENDPTVCIQKAGPQPGASNIWQHCLHIRFCVARRAKLYSPDSPKMAVAPYPVHWGITYPFQAGNLESGNGSADIIRASKQCVKPKKHAVEAVAAKSSNNIDSTESGTWQSKSPRGCDMSSWKLSGRVVGNRETSAKKQAQTQSSGNQHKAAVSLVLSM